MADEEKKIRAFLAIEPPVEILAAVSRLQEKLKRELAGKVSWTRPEGNHLTLKFFGYIDQSDVDNICQAVRKRAALVKPLSLTVKKIGVFPSPKRARVLWIGIEGEMERLAALQNDLDKDFASLGFPRESRPFKGHLTLGRIKLPGSVQGIEEALEKYEDFTAGEFQARELVLFQSHLSSHGATYTRLQTIMLGESE